MDQIKTIKRTCETASRQTKEAYFAAKCVINGYQMQ